jgi:hypothetical protein
VAWSEYHLSRAEDFRYATLCQNFILLGRSVQLEFQILTFYLWAVLHSSAGMYGLALTWLSGAVVFALLSSLRFLRIQLLFFAKVLRDVECLHAAATL